MLYHVEILWMCTMNKNTLLITVKAYLCILCAFVIITVYRDYILQVIGLK